MVKKLLLVFALLSLIVLIGANPLPEESETDEEVDAKVIQERCSDSALDKLVEDFKRVYQGVGDVDENVFIQVLELQELCEEKLAAKFNEHHFDLDQDGEDL